MSVNVINRNKQKLLSHVLNPRLVKKEQKSYEEREDEEEEEEEEVGSHSMWVCDASFPPPVMLAYQEVEKTSKLLSYG